MNSKTSLCIKWIMLSILFTSIILVLASAAWADSLRPPGTDAGNLSKAEVTLEKKSATMVITRMDEHYAIDKGSLIVGEDGKQVLIQHLLVPCEALLVYETKANGTRLVHRIEVRSTLEGATNKMWEQPR